VSYEQNDQNERKQESVYSKRVRAGKRRTYFFDIRETRGNDFFLTITESRKRFDDNGYDRHKVFVYKEDFNKFVKALNETVDYVKTELMPNFDFDAFNHEYTEGDGTPYTHVENETAINNVVEQDEVVAETASMVEEIVAPVAVEEVIEVKNNGSTEVVDKW
jgi:hypothetical protein